MRNYTDEQLKDMSFRTSYQKKLGKTLRAYQWRNLKLEICEQFPDEELSKEKLEIIARYKKVSPNWKISKKGIELLEKECKSIQFSGIDGASLRLLCRKICGYNVTDRTITQWFYDVCSTAKLDNNYTKQQAEDICLKAMTSKPRGRRQ